MTFFKKNKKTTTLCYYNKLYELICIIYTFQLLLLEHEDKGGGVGGGRVLRKSLQWPVQQPQGGAHQHQSTEALALEQFRLVIKTKIVK